MQLPRVEDILREKRQFTRAEVESRCTRGAVEVIVHNNVYDVTEFLDDHPGGREVLSRAAGRDASDQFHEVNHSQIAEELMKQFLIGEVVAAERRAVPLQVRGSVDRAPPPPFWRQWALPALLVLLLVLVYSSLEG